MNWEDECYLLSKRKFRENANIVNVFTFKKGRVGGIIYGGNSRKIRNYLQISNKLFVINNSKSESKIGYFKTELIKPIIPLYFNNKEKTSALISICSILNTLLPESQPHKKIYILFEKFLDIINFDNWIIPYIFFEINIIKELGFDSNLSSFLETNVDTSKLSKIKIDSYTYEVPNYLIQQKIPNVIDKFLIKKSLIFNRNVFMNKFFIPNNLIFPKSRVILENYFN